MDGWAIGLPKMSEEELKEKAKDADIIITSYDDITKGVIDAAPNLKLIACTRATPVNIDCGYAKEKGIPVVFTPGRNSDSAAELTIWLILSCARHTPQAYRALHEGKFLAPANRVLFFSIFYRKRHSRIDAPRAVGRIHDTKVYSHIFGMQ